MMRPHQDHFLQPHAKCCRSLLKEVKVAGITRIVLDCAPENVRTVLMQAQQVGMMSGEEENELGKQSIFLPIIMVSNLIRHLYNLNPLGKT